MSNPMLRTSRSAEQLNDRNQGIRSPRPQVLDDTEEVTLLSRQESSSYDPRRGIAPSDQSATPSSTQAAPKAPSSAGNIPLCKVRSKAAHAPYSVGRVDRFKVGHWLFELGAIYISICSFAAVVGVLIRQNNKPISDWNFPTSINTVVSVLGTISRSSLAFAVAACLGQQKCSWYHERPSTLAIFKNFDNATRGPLGGGQLLFSLRGR